MQKIHLYKIPRRLTKPFKFGQEGAYEYELYPEQAKRLPKHYVNRCIEYHETEPKPIHYIVEPGRWKLNEKNQKVRVENLPLPMTFPVNANHGLWGGEGVLQGYVKKDRRDKKETPIISRIWKPQVYKRPLYSEILDQWYSVEVTFSTLDQIDEALGFDNYILKTKERHINSWLGMLFRREMLLALEREEMYPQDEKKKRRILTKYAQFRIPAEEAEWIGLTVMEALRKAEAIEKAKEVIVPMKEELLKQFVLRIKGHLKDADDDRLPGMEETSETPDSQLLKGVTPYQIPKPDIKSLQEELPGSQENEKSELSGSQENEKSELSGSQENEKSELSGSQENEKSELPGSQEKEKMKK